jgi:HSP20 family protein
MTDLSKWNPFKFNRGDREAKDNPTRKSHAPAAPPTVPMAFRDLWSMMDSLRDESLWPSRWGRMSELDQWFGDFSSRSFMPKVDVADDGESLSVSAELPGLDRDDVEITVDRGLLTLRGRKQVDSAAERNGVFRTERSYGSFVRQIPLPDGVNLDAIEARFSKGVLSVRLPKKPEQAPKVRSIPISS